MNAARPLYKYSESKQLPDSHEMYKFGHFGYVLKYRWKDRVAPVVWNAPNQNNFKVGNISNVIMIKLSI